MWREVWRRSWFVSWFFLRWRAEQAPPLRLRCWMAELRVDIGIGEGVGRALELLA
jgi:hypothetical protein